MNRGIKTISNLLEKTEKKLFMYQHKQEEIKKIILETIKLKNKRIQINVKNKVVHIKTNPTIKNEILLKKEEILKNLKKTSKTGVDDLK